MAEDFRGTKEVESVGESLGAVVISSSRGNIKEGVEKIKRPHPNGNDREKTKQRQLTWKGRWKWNWGKGNMSRLK